MENPRKAAKCIDFLSTGEMMNFHRKGGEMGRGSLSTENPHAENRKCGEKGWGDPAKFYRETLRRGDPCGRPPHRTSCCSSVGADAYIGPPGLIPHLLLTMSLRSQCAHWLWQSVLLWICAGVLRIPTTSLRTGLGMTREFFRFLSLVSQ